VHHVYTLNNAKQRFKEEGYPDIGWMILPKRAHAFLKATLRVVKSSAHRRKRQKLRAILPCAAYYGLKGFRIM
jgi:hypothetical protein